MIFGTYEFRIYPFSMISIMDFVFLTSFENLSIFYNHKFKDSSFPKLFISFQNQNQKLNLKMSYLLHHYRILHLQFFYISNFQVSQNTNLQIKFSEK
jgi:hypothetical protein